MHGTLLSQTSKELSQFLEEKKVETSTGGSTQMTESHMLYTAALFVTVYQGNKFKKCLNRSGFLVAASEETVWNYGRTWKGEHEAREKDEEVGHYL